MKLLIISDIEVLHWNLDTGQADILISCGDVPNQVILESAIIFHCQKIFAVKGNHDDDCPFPSPIENLHLRTQEYAGVKFGGFQGAWKYKPKGHFLYDQHEVESLLAAFPRVDIFITHNSPRGIHDKEDSVHTGFNGINNYILRTKPRLVIHGHQAVNMESRFGKTKIIGVFGHRLQALK